MNTAGLFCWHSPTEKPQFCSALSGLGSTWLNLKGSCGFYCEDTIKRLKEQANFSNITSEKQYSPRTSEDNAAVGPPEFLGAPVGVTVSLPGRSPISAGASQRRALLWQGCSRLDCYTDSESHCPSHLRHSYLPLTDQINQRGGKKRSLAVKQTLSLRDFQGLRAIQFN